jgi:uncharacterized membrane protein YkgB
MGLALILIWIGLFKFTPTEAKAIEPMISNSPLMKWMYHIASINSVSKIIGTIEVITGLLLLLNYFTPYGGLVGGFMASATFIVTISFIFTTPNAIEKIDGFLLPDAFILKDIMALGISLTIFIKSFHEIYRP